MIPGTQVAALLAAATQCRDVKMLQGWVYVGFSTACHLFDKTIDAHIAVYAILWLRGSDWLRLRPRLRVRAVGLVLFVSLSSRTYILVQQYE